MKFLTLILAFSSALAFSQEVLDVRFLETQRTHSSPYAIPVSINSKGEVSLFGDNGTTDLSFQPTIQAGYSRVKIEYSQPVILNRFNFFPIQKELGWIEVKRQKIEAGLGLSSIIKSATTVGLIPYKGAMQTIIRHKASQEETSLPFRMPKKLSDLEVWNEGDLGTFQRYGGISAYAGFSAGIIDIATVSLGIQNQFLIEMKKESEYEVTIKIGEEDLKRRQLVLGPTIAKATFGQFSGKRFSAEFKLDMRESLHHELFMKALEGNLKPLQENLPAKLQKTTWVGKDQQYYVGIPAVIGKVSSKGHYELNEDGVETELDFIGKRNRGFLTPLRNHRDFVYQTDESIVMVWSSEMNKVNKSAFEKAFYSKGRIIGVKGFDREFPENTNFGSVVSQIGLHVTRKEAEGAREIDLNIVQENFRLRCVKENLSCRKAKTLRKVMGQFKELLFKPWKEMRGEMGILLIKNPALIHAVVKTLKYKKEVYFKFLTEKYQSLEGSSVIEI